MAYAAVSDVQARNPYRTIGASSKPTTTQVTAWITEAEAEVNGLLSALGLTSPATGDGATILKHKVVAYVAGLVQQAYANAGGDENDDGRAEIDAWDQFLDELAAESVKWGGVLQGGSAGTGAAKARSHTTHNRDSLTVSGGHFSATYAKSDPETQF